MQVRNNNTHSEIEEYYHEYRKKNLTEKPATFKATIKAKLVLLENAIVFFFMHI